MPPCVSPLYSGALSRALYFPLVTRERLNKMKTFRRQNISVLQDSKGLDVLAYYSEAPPGPPPTLPDNNPRNSGQKRGWRRIKRPGVAVFLLLLCTRGIRRWLNGSRKYLAAVSHISERNSQSRKKFDITPFPWRGGGEREQ